MHGVTLGASIGATVQNYHQGSRQAPQWLPSALKGVARIGISAILIAAIAQTNTPTSTTYTNGIPTVHIERR